MDKMETSNFKRVLNRKDIFVIAFGAMIGWGWVVNIGEWLTNAGAIGATIAFLLGGLMIFFVGVIYAELTAAMPKCGGEHIFSYRAMGRLGSFICTWSIILSYVAIAAFEAASIPTVVRHIVGEAFDIGYMYSINGMPIYISHVIVGCSLTLLITWVNIRGIKTAALLQRIFTLVIGLSGILLVVASVINGDPANISTNMFSSPELFDGNIWGGILTVTCMTPYLFLGFDVIPQTAEEINVPYKKIGKIILFSIGIAVVFYVMVLLAVAYVMPLSEISYSMEHGLVTADAMAIAFRSDTMSNVLIIGGMCGIITSWNSFMLGGSRALFAMGESDMLPGSFGILHKKYKTPMMAILLCGVVCFIAPFFGKKVLLWLADVSSFACCLAYLLVSISFLILRKKRADMKRPYKIRHGKLIGSISCILTAGMVLLYLIPIPFSSCTLSLPEWVIVVVWTVLGIMFYMKKSAVPKRNEEEL